jgi:hypothetical protein
LEKIKPEKTDITVTVMETFVIPPPDIDKEDIDNEIYKITKAVPNDDVDWKSLPRHNTNSPQMCSKHFNYPRDAKTPDLIKKLQNSAWFVTPLNKCNERIKRETIIV